MSSNANVAPLKQILENIRFPEQLDTHPWVGFRFVQDAVIQSPDLAQKSPGYQLAAAVCSQFQKLMPNTAPKQGKRLDTRWGKFGILAAQYFAPFRFGLPYPSSLQDAWGGIDQAVFMFVYGKPVDLLSPQEIALYKFVGDEPMVAARSTISDWHIKGSAQLADVILEYERYLESLPAAPEPIPNSEQLAEVISEFEQKTESLPAASGPGPDSVLPVIKENEKPTRPARVGKWLKILVRWSVAILFATLLIVLGLKAWKVYQLVMQLRADVTQLRGLISASPSAEEIKQAGPILGKLHQEMVSLNEELAAPLGMAGPWLAGLPGYGPELAASASLLEMAEKVTASAQIVYETAYPVYLQFQTSKITAPELTRNLLKMQPQLLLAKADLDKALAIRAGLDVSRFSARTQGLIPEIDRLLGLMQDGLSLSQSIPKILGASAEGPKTYMLVVQNEDELRPTGGFIGVVGSFVVKDGLPMGFTFKDSYAFDDWTKPYPEAPWQLEQYMNIPALVLRDANWYTNFPVAASWIEYLYAYSDNHTVDGVIAIDQQSLVYILQAIGPITVKGASEPVTSANIIQFMRDAKAPPASAKNPNQWMYEHRKDFVAPLANSIVEKLLSGQDIVWEKLVRTMIRALNERHILLQFDDPLVTSFIAKYDWGGEVKPGAGDFLMAVDTNVGVNKANAGVESKLAYSVDLTDLENPIGSLVVFHKNNASSAASCSKYGSGDNLMHPYYAIDRCYWNYLRIYVPAGSRLQDSSPHFIPAEGTYFGKSVPARVDVLDMQSEEIDSATGFGTLLAVPGGVTSSTGFNYLLPASVLANEGADAKHKIYTLKIQKQPGVTMIPVTFRIHLPAGAQLHNAPPGALVQGSDILLDLNMTTNINIRVEFYIP